MRRAARTDQTAKDLVLAARQMGAKVREEKEQGENMLNANPVSSHTATREITALPVTVYPYRHGVGMGNIIWADRNLGDAYYRVSKYAMRNGRFPANHPVAPGEARSNEKAEMGTADGLAQFRARGYWASCFPEGDGITWKPENGQSDEQCMADIRACFPHLKARWAKGL